MKLPLKSRLIALMLIPTSASAMATTPSETPAPSQAGDRRETCLELLRSGRTSGEYGKANVANPQSVGALHLDRITTLEGALPTCAASPPSPKVPNRNTTNYCWNKFSSVSSPSSGVSMKSISMY